MKRWCVMGILGKALVAAAAAAAEDPSPAWPVVLREGFAALPDDWHMKAFVWQVEGGEARVRCAEGSRNEFAYPVLARVERELAVEALVTVRERVAAEGWSFAGLAILQDASNFWLLALTEGPDGSRYMDFLENHGGVWQAQSSGATRLPVMLEKGPMAWAPGQAYRLRLVLHRDRVEAWVWDAPGSLLSQAAFGLPEGVVAVRSGVPALVARGSGAGFRELTVRSPVTAAASLPGLAVEEGPAGTVAILVSVRGGAGQRGAARTATALRGAGFGVTLLNAEQVCDAEILTARRFHYLVIPDCRSYPASGGDALAAYARQGGHVIFQGGPFLDDPLWRIGGRWLGRADIEALRSATPGRHVPFAIETGMDLGDWQRATGDRGADGSWQAAAEGPAGSPCLVFRAEAYGTWDGYLSPPVRIYGDGDDLLLFDAQGDAATSQISVEIQEEDASRWIATVPVTTAWRRVALPVAEFHYWHDSPTKATRGLGKDHLHPAGARRINFGLSGSHTPAVPAGAHVFRVANLGSAADPAGDGEPAGAELPNSLESIWPRYKVYPLAEEVSLQAATGLGGLPAQAPAATSGMIAAVPRTQGRGWERGQRWRYLPLLEARAADGAQRGSPAWLLLNRDMPYAGSVLVGLGFGGAEGLADSRALREWLVATLVRIAEGCFLTEAGSEHFAYWPGEPVRLGCRVMNVGRRAGAGTVVCTVAEAVSGRVVWSERAAMRVDPRREVIWQGTWQPDAAPAAYRVSVGLLGADGSPRDEIQHELAVLDPDPAPATDFITVRDGNFLLRGEPWYPVGVNYWPLYVAGMDHGDYGAGWLDRRFYEPELVEEDLGRMAALGINMVSIQSGDPAFHRNLLDFLRRCGPHGIKVNLFCGLASPLAFRGEALAAYIETARLRGNPTLFAYDTIWEPGNYVFSQDRRPGWDEAWRAWISERYGSLEAAEADWEMQAPRDGQGRAVSPREAWFREEGPWRVLVAAYRRFMDDLSSSLWGKAHRELRRLDPNHLVSFRQGNTLPHDFVFTGTPKHIDFICPEGYSIRHTDDDGFAAGFITRYVDFTTRGKPVLWSEFGRSVWDGARMAPSADAIVTQGEYHERFYRMVLESGAHGTAPWWWPGGYRVGERSDYGIVNPDGTPRPAALLIARHAEKLKTPRQRPEPTTWFAMDRDAHAGGYWFVAFHTGRDAYRAALERGQVLGVRTAGTGTTSLDTPLIAVGNRPCNGSNPPKYLNAEFTRLALCDSQGVWVEAEDGAEIRVRRGTPVRAEVMVGNTQEAEWISADAAGGRPGAVFLATTAASGLAGRWPIPGRVPYLGDADFGTFELVPGIDAPVTIELGMVAADRAWFGERRTFRLLPVDAE
ncbi:MAG: hypothetical protein JXR77_00505 [Lentisphaeria bacterium]|nr:hypothetical protein [Lentisphaeria bacterium]